MSSNNLHRSILQEQQQFDRFLLNMYVDLYNSTEREIAILQERNEGLLERIYELDSLHRNMNLNTTGNRGFSRPINVGPLHTNTTTRPRLFTQPLTSNRGNNLNLWNSPLLTTTIRNFYDPIIVRPTLSQIDNATVNTTFGSIVNPINSECPISLERFEENTNVTQIAHCGHIFTPSQLSSWFNNNVRCPVCRYDIRNYNSSTEPIVGTNTTSTTNTQNTTNASHTTNQTHINYPTEMQRNVLNNFSSDLISNIQQNENGEITFDISSNYLINFARQALSDFITNDSTSTSLTDSSGNSLLMFETIFRR
jgi:hypothetical protein